MQHNRIMIGNQPTPVAKSRIAATEKIRPAQTGQIDISAGDIECRQMHFPPNRRRQIGRVEFAIVQRKPNLMRGSQEGAGGDGKP
jgi:hypothetical protein